MDDAKKPDVREQDRFLPIANISRIMKKSLPPNAKIAKDAKETVQVCRESARDGTQEFFPHAPSPPSPPFSASSPFILLFPPIFMIACSTHLTP